MTLTALQVCHKCELRQRPCSGPCACYDGVDILDHAARGECPKGRFAGTVAAPIARPPLRGVSVPIQPAPHPWPLYVRAIATLRHPADAGLGDTVQRLAAKVGGEHYKRLMKKLGSGCGCLVRQATLNARWPYSP